MNETTGVPWTDDYLRISAPYITALLDTALPLLAGADPDAKHRLTRTRPHAEEVLRKAIDRMLTARYGVGLPVNIGDELMVGFGTKMHRGTVAGFDGRFREWAAVELPVKGVKRRTWAPTHLLGLRPRRTDAAAQNPTQVTVPVSVAQQHSCRDTTLHEAGWSLLRQEWSDHDPFTEASNVMSCWTSSAEVDADEGEVADGRIEHDLDDAVDYIAHELDADHIFNRENNFRFPIIDWSGRVRQAAVTEVQMPFAEVTYTARDSGEVCVWTTAYRAAAVRYLGQAEVTL